jgi:hypothetical protein
VSGPHDELVDRRVLVRLVLLNQLIVARVHNLTVRSDIRQQKAKQASKKG